VVENRIERKIFGPKSDGVTGELRRLHNEELYDLYFSPNIRMRKSRIIKRAGHVERRRKRRNGYGVYVGKPETKRPIGRPRRRWEYKKGKAILLQALRVPEG
jgi:hypothetical protein